MVIPGIIASEVLPGVQRNPYRGRNTFEAHSFAGGAHTCADRLKNKNNSIGSGIIEAAEVNIKMKIKGIIQIDLGRVPHTAALSDLFRSKCVAIAIIFCSWTIEYVLAKWGKWENSSEQGEDAKLRHDGDSHVSLKIKKILQIKADLSTEFCLSVRRSERSVRTPLEIPL